MAASGEVVGEHGQRLRITRGFLHDLNCELIIRTDHSHIRMGRAALALGSGVGLSCLGG